MVLSDRTLHEHGAKLLDPFSPDAVQPASIDLHLSPQIAWWSENVYNADIDIRGEIPEMQTAEIVEYRHFRAGEFWIASTSETIHVPTNCVALVSGKSSLGRMGLMVHVTAGWLDPGFEGQITLELKNLQTKRSIILYSGMAICQVAFYQLDQPCLNPYAGKYQHQRGPTAVKSGKI